MPRTPWQRTHVHFTPLVMHSLTAHCSGPTFSKDGLGPMPFSMVQLFKDCLQNCEILAINMTAILTNESQVEENVVHVRVASNPIGPVNCPVQCQTPKVLQAALKELYHIPGRVNQYTEQEVIRHFAIVTIIARR